MAWPDGATDWDSDKICIWANAPALNLRGQQLLGQSASNSGVEDGNVTYGDNGLSGLLTNNDLPSPDTTDIDLFNYRERVTIPHTASGRMCKLNIYWGTTNSLNPSDYSSVFSGMIINANDPYNDANATYRPRFKVYGAVIRDDRDSVGGKINRWQFGDSSNDRGSFIGQNQALGPTTTSSIISQNLTLTPYQEGTSTEIKPSGHISKIIFGGVNTSTLYYVDRDGTVSGQSVRLVYQDDVYYYYATRYQWGFIWNIYTINGIGFSSSLSKSGAYLDSTKRLFGYESGGSLFNSYNPHDIYRPTGISSSSSLILNVEDYLYPEEEYSISSDEFFSNYNIYYSMRFLLCYPSSDILLVAK